MAAKDIFSGIREYCEFSSGDLSWRLPVLYRRLDAFSAIYTADFSAVKALMPTDRFELTRIGPGRTSVMLSAFNYLDTDVGPYGEFGVSVGVTVRHQGQKIRGVYIHRLPVTVDVAMVAGIECYGFPKFIAEMEHENTPSHYSVSITANEERILDLKVAKGGISKSFSGPVNLFTIKAGEIMQTKFLGQGVARIKPFGKSVLNLGDHEMAKEIKALDLGKRPFITGDLLDASAVLPEGKSIGPI